MKFMTTWSLIPGSAKEAIGKFLAGEAAPQPDVKLLGRWHNTDVNGGFVLVESNDPVELYADAAKWADLLELNTVPMIEDGDAGPALANR